MNWVLLLCLYTSKSFSQWSEFLLNCLYICIHMRVCVGWTSQTYEGKGSSWSAWIKCLYNCLSFGCSAVLFRLLQLLSLLIGWLDCLFGTFGAKFWNFLKIWSNGVSHSWIVSFSGLSWIVQHTHKLSLLGCYFDKTHKSPLLVQHVAYYLQSS